MRREEEEELGKRKEGGGREGKRSRVKGRESSYLDGFRVILKSPQGQAGRYVPYGEGLIHGSGNKISVRWAPGQALHGHGVVG
jgi:hypothetical protein